mgnify:CR=1 FL=1
MIESGFWRGMDDSEKILPFGEVNLHQIIAHFPPEYRIGESLVAVCITALLQRWWEC